MLLETIEVKFKLFIIGITAKLRARRMPYWTRSLGEVHDYPWFRSE
jgi:hypothetical protein